MMMTDNGQMTAEQAATLMRLAREAYELDAFKPNLTRAEADRRIAMLTAKLELLDGPPHTSETKRDQQDDQGADGGQLRQAAGAVARPPPKGFTG